MSINVSERHLVYIFFGKDVDWQRQKFWQALMQLLLPVTSRTTFTSEVNPSVFDPETEDFMEFDDIAWTTTDVNKWIAEPPANRQLKNVYVFFPSMNVCYESGITPDISIIVSGKPTEKEKRYDFVLALILKESFLKKLPQNDFKKVLRQLQEFTHSQFSIYKERPWALQDSDYYRDGLQNFFPSTVLANSNDFLYREGQEGWKQIKFS